MTQEKYIHSVLKKLKCSHQKKEEIKRELQADIAAAMENGESPDEILARMGIPKTLAAEFNDNFPEDELKAYKRKRRIKIAGIIAGILLILVLAALYFLPRNHPLEESGLYTEAGVKSRAEEAISYFYEKDYASMREMCAIEGMKHVLTDEAMTEVRKLFPEDWGSFITYGNAYTAEVTQMGNSMAVIQINATYEHTAITYTIMFDKDLNLCGFYVK